MGEKPVPTLLVVGLLSFVVFGIAHDFDLGSHESVAAGTIVEHAEPIPHVEEICALTLIGAGLVALRLRRALYRGGFVVRIPSSRTRSLLAPRRDDVPRCPGFQLVFPMLA